MPGLPGQNLIVGEQPSQLPNPNDNSTTLVLNQDPNFSIDLCPTDVFNYTNTYTLDANEGINWPQGETLYARVTPGQTTGTPSHPVNGVLVWVQPGGVVAPPHAISVSGGVNAQALQGWPISPANPTNGQGLFFNGTEWIPSSIGGDLSGFLPNPTVAAIQGKPVSSAAPSTGQGLVWNGSAWAPGSVGVSGPAGGDLTGSYPNPIVRALYTSPVSPDMQTHITIPNMVPVWTTDSASNWSWTPGMVVNSAVAGYGIAVTTTQSGAPSGTGASVTIASQVGAQSNSTWLQADQGPLAQGTWVAINNIAMSCAAGTWLFLASIAVYDTSQVNINHPVCISTSATTPTWPGWNSNCILCPITAGAGTYTFQGSLFAWASFTSTTTVYLIIDAQSPTLHVRSNWVNYCTQLFGFRFQ